MKCHVCKDTDTADSPCACIICNKCSKKTHDNDVIIGESPDEGMYCSVECGGNKPNKYYVVTVPELYLTQARVHALNEDDAIQQVMDGNCEYMLETQEFEETLDTEKFNWKVEEE